MYGLETNRVRHFFSPIGRLLGLDKLHSLFTDVFYGKSKERVYSNKSLYLVWKFIIPILMSLPMVQLCCIMKLLKTSNCDSRRPCFIKELK